MKQDKYERYYNGLDLEYGIVIEEAKWKCEAPLLKVYVPVLMPLLDDDKADLVKNQVVDISKQVNKFSSKKAPRITGANYVELGFPKYLYPKAGSDGYYTIKKGTKVILGFVGHSTNVEDIYIMRLKEDYY